MVKMWVIPMYFQKVQVFNKELYTILKNICMYLSLYLFECLTSQDGAIFREVIRYACI